MTAVRPLDEAKRRAMSRQRTRDTGPELAVRQRLHALGYRYRVDHRPLPDLRARGDLVFTRARVVVFVDGCFWHRCPQHVQEPGPTVGEGQQLELVVGCAARPALGHRGGGLDGTERRTEGVRGDEHAHAVRLSVS